MKICNKLQKTMLFLIILWLLPNFCIALEPEQILVIANKNVHESIDVATYYMSKRKIPAENILQIRVTDKETIGRIDYQANVAAPVRKYLKQNHVMFNIRCLVLMYGIPLKVDPPEIKPEKK